MVGIRHVLEQEGIMNVNQIITIGNEKIKLGQIAYVEYRQRNTPELIVWLAGRHDDPKKVQQGQSGFDEIWSAVGSNFSAVPHRQTTRLPVKKHDPQDHAEHVELHACNGETHRKGCRQCGYTWQEPCACDEREY